MKKNKKITFNKTESSRILFVSGLIILQIVKKIPHFSNEIRWYDKLFSYIMIIPPLFLTLVASSGLSSRDVQRDIYKLISFYKFYLPSIIIIVVNLIFTPKNTSYVSPQPIDNIG
jgi:hypothetical protein